MEENKTLPNGLTAEQVGALYFADGLREPAYKLYQLNGSGQRYYYKYDDDGRPEFYPSVTTVLSRTMPTAPHLIKWIADKGYDEAQAYKMERANYGTFMHACFEELIINKTFDLDTMPEKLRLYMAQKNLPDGFINYADELRKDVLAFAQFVIDYDVQPLAVEIALCSPALGLAGMLDLPCTMKKSPKSDERVTAIIDFKSGKNGFHDDYEIQLHLYRMLWNENFPDVEIERVYNFAPKAWRKSPTYTLKDQTDSAAAKKIPHLIALAKLDDDSADATFTYTEGVIDLRAKDVNLAENVFTLSLAEIVGTKEPERKPEKNKDADASEVKAEKPRKRATRAKKDASSITTPKEEKKRTRAKTAKNNSKDEKVCADE